MKKFFLSMMMLVTSAMSMWADGYHFQYEKGQDQHVIYLSLTDAEGTVLSQSNGLGDGAYYVGAFIDGECRGEAEVQFSYDGGTLDNLFTLMVQGNGSRENGKNITFRVYKESMVAVGTAEYRIPEATASVRFTKDATTGTPSSPYTVKFTPAVSMHLTESITVHKGGQVDMLSHITTEPENTLIPYPLSWVYSEDFVAIGEDILDALAVTDAGGTSVSLTAGTGIFAFEANTSVVVDNPATAFEWTNGQVVKDASDPSKGTVTVPVGYSLSRILDYGYALTPADASTTYTWLSDVWEVVGPSPTGSGMEALAVGTAVLTGTPQDGSTATAPQLTVKVINPVTTFQFVDPNNVVVVEVGDNLNQRLLSQMTVSPEDATDLTYTLSGFSAEDFEQQANGNLVAKKANSDGTTNQVSPITITANDGFGASAVVNVVIIQKQPTSIDPVTNTLYITNPDEPLDITDQLYGNLVLTPNDLNIADFTLNMSPSDESVITTEYPPVGGAPAYMLQHQSGEVSVTMNVTMSVLDKDNYYSEVDFSSGDIRVNISQKRLMTTFIVDVREGLSEFTFNPVIAISGEEVELTLVPQPAGVDYDGSKISVEVTPSVEMPNGWTFATIAPKTGDATGLNWVINTKSVGNGTITVNYEKDGAPVQMGRGSIKVQQRLDLSEGWQWISLYQGCVYGTDSMRTYYGAANLGEIRGDNSTIYNDDSYGYFGALTTLEMVKTYKVRMKAATYFNIEDTELNSTYFANNVTGNDPTGAPLPSTYTVAAAKGWNWIGNPYQYSRKLSDIFGDTQFSEGDIIKGKENFATYTNGAWGGMETLEPGQGYMFSLANAGNIEFTREFALEQPTEAPAMARANSTSPWTIDHRRFADNMSMIAYVGGFDDNSHIILYAFCGNECRGRGVAVDDRQFITIHGERGERFTFRAYDELTGQYYDVIGSRAFTTVSGSYANPVPLYAGNTTSIEAINGKAVANDDVYDLQGRRMGNGNLKKGIYVQQGKKVVK